MNMNTGNSVSMLSPIHQLNLICLRFMNMNRDSEDDIKDDKTDRTFDRNVKQLIQQLEQLYPGIVGYSGR